MASVPHTPEGVPAPMDPGHGDAGITSGPDSGPDAALVPQGAAGRAEPRLEPADRDLEDRPQVTRAGMIWTATVAGLIVLVLLIIFIAQNQDQVTLRYFGFEGPVNLGLALFIAAVSGGLLTAMAGTARIIQLRARAHRKRKDRNRRRGRPR